MVKPAVRAVYVGCQAKVDGALGLCDPLEKPSKKLGHAGIDWIA